MMARLLRACRYEVRTAGTVGDAFAAAEAPGMRIRFTVTNGRATAVLFDQGARPLGGKRVE
jgi:hypothetical protein